MLQWFEYHGHVCIVFELLGLSTFDFMKEPGFQPLSMDRIRQVLYQLCQSVNFLHLNKLTHTDLKPENILFVKSDYTADYNPTLTQDEHQLRIPDIKVADFGNATYDDEYHSPLVTTRDFRAPEVILGLGWSQPCDIWSIGCVLMEYVGNVLFPTHNILGPLSRHMIQNIYFNCNQLDWDENTRAGQRVSRLSKPLPEYMTCINGEHRNLSDLTGKMLEYDPAKRITLGEALKLPFFFSLKWEKRSRFPAGEEAERGFPAKKWKKV
uniref:dual-specificity kinase n=1 Tax=Strigops habroptila TaxID=2489341 RepID=A0A672VF91_STRHB